MRNADLLTSQVERNHAAGLLYLLDASCSACIAEFMNFTKVYLKSEITLPCKVFIENTYSAMLEYYLEQNKILIPTSMVLIEMEQEFPFGMNADGANIVLTDSAGNTISHLVLPPVSPPKTS